MPRERCGFLCEAGRVGVIVLIADEKSHFWWKYHRRSMVSGCLNLYTHAPLRYIQARIMVD